MGNFSAQENDDVMTIENNWQVRKHVWALTRLRFESSVLKRQFIFLIRNPQSPQCLQVQFRFNNVVIFSFITYFKHEIIFVSSAKHRGT